MTDGAKPGRRTRATWRTWAGRCGLLVATLFIGVLTLEIGTRLLVDVTPPITVRDGRIGARQLRSFQGNVFVDEIGRDVPLRFNDVGFRGPDRPFEKPPGTVRVAVMGDSMIASIAVIEDELMTTKLERQLNESFPSTRWEVMNFGVGGASPAQGIALYRELVRKFDPDIVLSCFYVGNDLADNSNRLSNDPRIYFDLDEDGNYRQLPYSVSRSRASRWLNRYSRFYVWQKRATKIARVSVRDATKGVAPRKLVFAAEESDDVAHAWMLTSKAFETLQAEVTSHGRMFGVVVVPTWLQIYQESFRNLMESAPEQTRSFDAMHPERRLRGICDRLGIACWTLTDDFLAESPSRSRRATNEWLFLDGAGHLNERGNTVAARSLYRFLTDAPAGQPGGRSMVQRAIDPGS